MQPHTRAPQSLLVPPGQVDHQVADLTATLSATATLAQVQETLAKHDQWLPIDGDPSSPVGLLVDTNSTGPLRLGYGAWRDLLLGLQFTSGRGDLITAGGQTMKNVAGYDLTKFLVGASGHFGQLQTLTTRTYKRPTSALLATFSPDIPILNSLLSTPSRPHCPSSPTTPSSAATSATATPSTSTSRTSAPTTRSKSNNNPSKTIAPSA